MDRKILYECVERLEVPLEVKEDLMSYSEQYKLEICRNLFEKGEAVINLMVFDKSERKRVMNVVEDLSSKYGVKIGYDVY